MPRSRTRKGIYFLGCTWKPGSSSTIKSWRAYRKKPFPILCFDDDEAVLDEKIFRVAKEMGLSHGGGEDKFYTAELKHNDSSGGPALPWRVRRLYNKLEKYGL